jgi:hypothetical protein
MLRYTFASHSVLWPRAGTIALPIALVAVCLAAPARLLVAAEPGTSPAPSIEVERSIPLAVSIRKAEVARMDPTKGSGYGTFRSSHHECPSGNPHVQGVGCNTSNPQELTTADCVLTDGSRADFWSFPGAAGEEVTITMTAGFDTFLFLLDPSATVVALDDDGGGGTNSRIVFTLTSTGTWFIVTNSFFPNVFGLYTMTVACATLGATPTPTATVSAPATTSTPSPTAGGGGVTATPGGGGTVVGVPTLSLSALALLAVILAATALVFLRRA